MLRLQAVAGSGVGRASPTVYVMHCLPRPNTRKLPTSASRQTYPLPILQALPKEHLQCLAGQAATRMADRSAQLGLERATDLKIWGNNLHV